MDKSRKGSLKAFTLLELIVVIAIVAVLTAIIIPNMATNIRDSKITTANTTAQEVYTAAQEYLISMQMQGKKADTCFGSTVIGGVTTGYIGLMSQPGTDVTSADIKLCPTGTDTSKAADAANGIRSRLSTDFKGAWIIEIYPSTYTVKSVVFCNQPPKSGSDPFDWTAVEYVGNPASPHYYTSVDGDFNAGTNTGSQSGAIQHSSAANKQYVGQYPIPIT